MRRWIYFDLSCREAWAALSILKRSSAVSAILKNFRLSNKNATNSSVGPRDEMVSVSFQQEKKCLSESVGEIS